MSKTHSELGEIKCSQELGYKGCHAYQWLACEQCDKERWVRLLKGEPISRFCRSCNTNGAGEDNSHWGGGKIKNNEGYVLIYLPEHPHCLNGRYILEHRLVIEEILGRYLLPTEIIHHIDGNRTNNKPSNLRLLNCKGEHTKLHAKIRNKGNYEQ